MGSVSFSCPHCGTLTHQTWYRLFSDKYEKNSKPFISDPDTAQRIRADKELGGEAAENLARYFERQSAREVFFDDVGTPLYLKWTVINLSISVCYTCDKIAFWEGDRLISPHQLYFVTPSTEMPEQILSDFKEAASIVDASPRGAAALLRLCIQKLMKQLGEAGGNINDDIGNLVKKGLDPRIQQALDVVRVVGNNAVHPGQIDLKDDKPTAIKLFGLVNVIVDAMIATPKHIKGMYEAVIPETVRVQIEKRDGIQKASEEKKK